MKLNIFWVYNLLFTSLILVVYGILQSVYFNTTAEIYSAALFIVLILLQCTVSLISQGIKRIGKYSFSIGMLAIISLLFMFFAALFIFNASFWDTNTGSFRIFN